MQGKRRKQGLCGEKRGWVGGWGAGGASSGCQGWGVLCVVVVVGGGETGWGWWMRESGGVRGVRGAGLVQLAALAVLPVTGESAV